MKRLWVPADRILAVIDREGVSQLEKGSTIPRTLSRLRNGNQAAMSLDAADRMLIRLGLEHYWHIPPEDGGLADIYEADSRRVCSCHGMPMQKNGGGRWRCSIRNNHRMMLAYALGEAA